MNTTKSTIVKILKFSSGILLAFAIIMAGCRSSDDPEPDDNDGGNNGGGDDSSSTDTTILIADFNGSGVYTDGWSIQSDSSELETSEVAIAPNDSDPDSSYHMAGTDDIGSVDWWIGSLVNDGNNFGLTADPEDITIEMDVYLNNGTSNFEIQLMEEADGEGWKLNAGGDAGADLSQGGRTYSFALDQFVRSTDFGGTQNDSVLTTSELDYIGIALISGSETGNTSDIYVDNIKFIQE